ncbi:MAG: glycerate kinase [Faecousia sp.]
MNYRLRKDAECIVRRAIASVCPEEAVKKSLSGQRFSGRLYLVAVGKAAWKMAQAALDCLEQPVEQGIVVTKYGHVERPLPGITCFEAGHPVPDENGFAATQAVLDMTAGLTGADTVLFLLSGGGSALFEKPLISGRELGDITAQLLACGADIVEMNTIRKRLSAVKGGRFAQWCAPARVEAVVLSDVLGDPLDMIASGPAAPDGSTCAQALAIAEKYSLRFSGEAKKCLREETPKVLTNVHTQIIGSVRQLVSAAAQEARALGYEPVILTDRLDCQAREAGFFLGGILRSHASCRRKLAWIAGGETVVHLTGKGLGGRNQELALAAATRIAGLPNAAVLSAGSDGTDGPTDAAGGYADGDTAAVLEEQGISIHRILEENDSYHALQSSNGLFFTGPTGTNVNDVTVGLIE